MFLRFLSLTVLFIAIPIAKADDADNVARAARAGNFIEVEKILKDDPKLVNAKSKLYNERGGGITALVAAVEELAFEKDEKFDKTAIALIKAGADIETTIIPSAGAKAISLLRFQAMMGRPKAVEFLLLNKAKVTKEDLAFAKEKLKECIDNYGEDPAAETDCPIRCYKPQLDKQRTSIARLEKALEPEKK